jgi:outer membrane immunogenic protein
MTSSLRLALVALAIFSAPAVGADVARRAPPLPAIERSPPPVWVWSGFHAGINIGYGWENASSPTFSGTSPIIPILQGMAADGLRYEAQGVLGGVQFGFNHQISQRIVLGAEADIQLSGMRRANQAANVAGLGLSGEFSRSLDWFGTLRLRGGFLATERVMIYATGGLAYGGARVSALASDAAGQIASVSASQTRFGYTVGTGTEVLLTRRLSVRAEYLFYDFGTIRATASDLSPAAGPTASAEIRSFGHLLRTGVSYRF